MDIEELTMMLESLDVQTVSIEEFLKAAEKAKKFTFLDDEQQLLLYALYKQSTIGDNSMKEPNSEDILATMKWFLSSFTYFYFRRRNYK
jgi:hypothetical protein